LQYCLLVIKIAYIDGPRLKQAILAGAGSIVVNAEGLNAINVFPVPDGDTGTNMAGTARAIAASLKGVSSRGAGAVLKQAARSAMEGARGNSGAILAQFLQGLAHELGAEARIGARRLAQAATIAAEKTKKALRVPKDGTILTVLDDWAKALRAEAAVCEDILQVFFSSLEAARASLERTRNILPEMRKAGVVDAGAKGFIHLLEGVADLLMRGRRRASRFENPAAALLQKETAETIGDIHVELTEGGGPRYCTEALLENSRESLEKLRDALSELGDSLVVAGDEEIARVHLHSDTPWAVFDLLDAAGDVSGHKVDDMELQRRLVKRSAAAGKAIRCAIVTDTGCDLPAEYLLEKGIIKVPALIRVGTVTRPDGPAMDLRAVHARMREEPDFSMSTSQPTAASFTRAFNLALSQAGEVLYIGLSSALSGTFQAGAAAAEEFTGRVSCFDSRSITAGQGALVEAASQLAESGLGAEEIQAILEKRRKNLELFVAVKDLRSLIRSGRLKGVKSIILRKFGLRPILGTDAAGKAKNRSIYLGEKNASAALFASIRKIIKSDQAEGLQIVHVDARGEAEALAERCRAEAGGNLCIQVADMGPLLASVGWLGALGVAVLRRS
jgi:DegV family protein with EDD domain